MTTPDENHQALIVTGSRAIVHRMDHRLELVGRLMEEIQAKESSGTDAELAVLEPAEAHELLEGSRPGEEREFEIAPGVKMTFCWCPPGDFVMGSPDTEDDMFNDEDQVKVTLSKSYWMGKYQVKQAQWQAVMGSNPSRFKGANMPVETVSWNDVQEFLQKLNARLGSADGRTMVLPTEAQWEYAARAGETGLYSGGSIDEVAWYSGNSGMTTHEVGTKKPNAWGLHDMCGNVWEWCADWYGESLSGGMDPKGPASGTYRVDRGGSWGNGTAYCNVADRRDIKPSFKSDFAGFRIARSSVH
jgi:formylglycine-generating enzyme required for sulfatase activity